MALIGPTCAAYSWHFPLAIDLGVGSGCTHTGQADLGGEKNSLIPPDLHSKDCLASTALLVYVLETASLRVSKVPLLSFKQDFI